MVLSLTDDNNAGLLKMSASSSSMMLTLSPPSAAAWALTGNRRKLYSVRLSCAFISTAIRVSRSSMATFFI